MNNRDAALSWCERNLARNGSLQRDGVTWLCSSPFRGDREPSLSADIQKRCFKDHGTDEHGTLSELAGLMGVEPPPYDKSEREGKESSTARAEAKPDKSGDAVKLWKSGKAAGGDHPYLVRKGVKSHGCRETTIGGERVLLVGAYDEAGALAGLERIWPDGRKKHLGQKSGAFHLLGTVDVGRPIVLTEGFATGASVHEATGYATVVCFGKENVPVIAKRLREKHPGLELIAATDNDPAGEEAAAACPPGTLVCIPSGAIPHLDWNDVAVELGSEEARRQFTQKLAAARATAPSAPEERKPRYELVRIGDIELVEPEYLVHGLIEDKTLGMIFGASGSMKSFIALDLAASIATGCSFHGRITEQGPVVYLAGEGFNGIKRRLTAWELNSGVSLKDAPLYISRRAPTLANRESARDVAEAIRNMAEDVGHPALIVVDTLSRSAVGADENSNSDMGEYVETLDEIRHEHDCTLMTVHHSGLADKDRGRGASAIHAALDFEYQVTKDGMSVALINKKTKDGPEPEPIFFEATEVTVGQARNGDAITSVALDEVDEAPRERKKELTPVQKLALDTFMIAAEKVGTLDEDGAFVGLHVDDWRPFFHEKHTGDNAHTKNTAFNRAREKLVERGELIVKDSYYRLNGACAILEKGIVEKLRESGSHKSQEGHMCVTCDSSQGGGQVTHVTHSYRNVTCDFPVTSEKLAKEEKTTEESCAVSDEDTPKEVFRSPVPEDRASTSAAPVDSPGPTSPSREKSSDEKIKKREEVELERIFKDAEPDEGTSPSRGIPIDAVPADVALPCLVFDGKKDRWLVRVDVLSTGKRLFHTAWSEKGRVTWSFEEPVKAAAS